MKMSKVRADFGGYDLAEVNEATAVEVLEYLFLKQNAWRNADPTEALYVLERKLRIWRTRLYAETPAGGSCVPSTPIAITVTDAPRTAEERRAVLAEMLAADPDASIAMLASVLGVSGNTIRNDRSRLALGVPA